MQLQIANQLTNTKPSPFVQEVDLDAFDNESVKGSSNKETKNKFRDPAAEELFDILSTKVKSQTQSQKMKKQVSKTDVQKQASLLEEIFDYIYVTKYQCLFLLIWYNNTTYSNNKSLPSLCCKRSRYNLQEPECLKREPFIEILSIKYSKTDRK